MSTLINGFLNVSRFELSKIHLDERKFDLSQLIAEMIEESELYIEINQLENLNSHETEVTADRDKIGSVKKLNLLQIIYILPWAEVP
jgi:two-component system sensor histidine kinase VicK